MKHRSFIQYVLILSFLFLVSCLDSDKEKNLAPQGSNKDNLAQKKSRLLIDKGENLISDSSFIWTDNIREFNKCKITRIKDNGFYKYYFWNTQIKPSIILLEDSVPIVEFISDTLFDVNGDAFKDLLINGHFTNGQCPPKYAILYCFDITSNMFIEIPIINEIPNPKFSPSSKSVTGESDCMMQKDIYKFKWSGLRLDTISITTKPLN